jgi:glucosamine 6-phosphate synthetase-like amidotransferase/phosphosugar isomerase protein
MKTGHCYSDVKSFVPQIIGMALVAIWFSDKKTTVLDKDIKNKRKALVKDIEKISGYINRTLEDDYIELYQGIAEALKGQTNLFLLGKGAGFFAANYMSQKFMQIAGIHAEAYPSGEFRHGPLSMIDDVEKTPGKTTLLY